MTRFASLSHGGCSAIPGAATSRVAAAIPSTSSSDSGGGKEPGYVAAHHGQHEADQLAAVVVSGPAVGRYERCVDRTGSDLWTRGSRARSAWQGRGAGRATLLDTVAVPNLCSVRARCRIASLADAICGGAGVPANSLVSPWSGEAVLEAPPGRRSGGKTSHTIPTSSDFYRKR